jgi:hypothetical protein
MRTYYQEQRARLNGEKSAEAAANGSFLAEYARVESSDLPQTKKEVALRRLVEHSDIKDTAREATSDVAFMSDLQRLKDAGCVE